MPLPRPLVTTGTTAHIDSQPTETTPTATTSSTAGRFSIDLSLELERQLANMESPPVTPAFDALTHHVEMADASLDTEANPKDSELDPTVLSHIITTLRSSLATITAERDTLLRSLTEREGVEEALNEMTLRATKAEDELEGARVKMREDEEQIGMLRGKVEESRFVFLLSLITFGV